MHHFTDLPADLGHMRLFAVHWVEQAKEFFSHTSGEMHTSTVIGEMFLEVSLPHLLFGVLHTSGILPEPHVFTAKEKLGILVTPISPYTYISSGIGIASGGRRASSCLSGNISSSTFRAGISLFVAV